MRKTDYKINIIGGGVSGLIAAQVLENHGYSPNIIEASDKVGGRVKSEIVEGYVLDHGFQVLLTAYPVAKKYLNFLDLEIQNLLPGAILFKEGKSSSIGDPLRNISFLFPTLFSTVGSVSDKFKILKLNRKLKKKKISKIFKEEEKTTLQYLKDFGFSDKIISNFFQPFFSGIFLESNLETSSRMFEFIYKMFGEGLAVLPKSGIQAIPDQLKNRLKNTSFLFNSPVKQVLNHKIILNNDTELKSHITLIATEAGSLISNLKNQDVAWKSCDTLYFEVNKRSYKKPLIGLITNKNSYINNIFYNTSVDTLYEGSKELLSVTIVKEHQLSEEELIKKVKEELALHCSIHNGRFIKRYQIKKALPNLTDLQYEISSTETKLKSTIFLAGDQLLNGSLNAAMLSGERAALGVIQALENGLIVDELTSEYA